MVQVLEPLEVGAGNTTTVCQHVWHGDDTSLQKRLFSEESGWTVSSFHDDFALKIVTVVFVNGLLFGSWDEDITFHLHKLRWVDVGFSAGLVESLEGSLIVPVHLHVVNIEAIW